MKIIALAGKSIEIIGYIDTKGNVVLELPDGQGIEKGCEVIGDLMAPGKMDHTGSLDWQKELQLSNARVIPQEDPRYQAPSTDNQLG
jgi:hypothetical protein